MAISVTRELSKAMQRLQLGAGKKPRPGWFNIDLNIETQFRHDGTIALRHDLREGLPFQDDYFDVIYSSHFFEHLDTTNGMELMAHCLRVLKPEGVFRAALPDVRPMFKAYVDRDMAYFDWVKSIDGKALPRKVTTPIDFIDRAARGWEHQTLYDPEKMTAMLARTGFVSIQETQYDPAFDPDSDSRRAFSFYMIGHKPKPAAPQT